MSRSSRKQDRALRKGARGAGRGSVLRKVARAGASRRRLQSLILVLVTAGSVAAALLAVQLLAGVDGAFDQAFARQQGSELTVQADASKADAAQLAASAHAAGVTAVAGPFPEVEIVHYTATTLPGFNAAFGLPPMTVVGRAAPGGPVDDVQLDAGHWAEAADQIVVANGSSALAGAQLGAKVTVSQLPGSPVLTIVGFATSVSQTADAWVLPQEAAALSPHGTAAGYQLLYRFAAGDTAAQLAADGRAVTAALPAGAVRATQSWLVLRDAADTGGLAIIPPFLAVFGVLGLVLAVTILVSTVNASIAAAARRIGILKALGCTPAQVVRTYCLQALIPCVLGVAVGTALGTLGASQLLGSTGRALDTGTPPLKLWPELVVPLGALALVAGTAVLAAGRAGRMSVLEALSAGHTPGAGRGRRAQLLLARSPLPRSISLGLAAPFTRPARALALILAVATGVLAATLAVGVAASLNQASNDVARGGSGGTGIQVEVGGENGPTLAQGAAAMATVQAQPGTAAYYTDTFFQLPVEGVSQDATVLEYVGDASWNHFPLISGHWLTGTGQAVVPTHLLRALNLRLGDSVTVMNGGRRFPLTIVGEVFDTDAGGMQVLTDAANFAAVQPQIPIGSLTVELKPGTDQASYLTALNRALAPADSSAAASQAGQGTLIVIMDALSVMLTLLLIVVAALGVVGSVVLDTRERVHDIGVYKALGMTPRQTTAMVLTSVLTLGVVAGAVGVPLGVFAHGLVLPLMGDAVQATLPANVIDVYHGAELLLLGLGGVAIALLAALGPAGWAGRIRTATALRTE